MVNNHFSDLKIAPTDEKKFVALKEYMKNSKNFSLPANLFYGETAVWYKPPPAPLGLATHDVAILSPIQNNY